MTYNANDVDIQLILEFKNSFEKYHPKNPCLTWLYSKKTLLDSFKKAPF